MIPLGSDRYPIVFEVFDGLISTAMTELELVGLGADGVRNNLMAEADSENRVIIDQSAYEFMNVSDGLWISGTVGKKDALRIDRFDFFDGRSRRENVNFEAVVSELAED